MMLKKIIYFVVAAHLGVLLFAMVSIKTKPVSQPTLIAVKTYLLPKPAIAQPKELVQPKAKPAKPARKKASDVMSEVQKNIAKIEKKKDNKKQSTQTAKAQKDQKKVALEPVEKPKVKPQYPQLLVQKLKSALHLPEEGDVRLEVTLKNSGEVIEVKVLSSKSPDNATYLEIEIPKMRFPMFTAELSGKKQHTFTLTFCHDD